jgi:hypothetical protein
MSAIRDERGVALLAVLGIIISLLPLAAAISMQTRLDGLMGRNFRGSTEAFYAAEAGLAHALSEIGPRADFEDLLYGPDQVGATSDDGSFPFRSQPPSSLRSGALGYQVSVGRGPANTLRIYSRGSGRHDATREVEVLIRPAATPFTPGAIYVEAAEVDVDLGGLGFTVSGIGEQQGAAQPSIVGLAVSSAALATRLHQTLTADTQVEGAGGSPSVAVAAGLDLDSYINSLRKRLDAVVLPTAPQAAAEPFGIETQPQLTVIDGNWSITARAEGFGILVVRGDLEVSGSLHFRGLLLVAGSVSTTASSDVQIDGALWVRRAAAELKLLGTGHVHYSPGALERTDSAIAGALLHLATVVGWREVA